MAGRDTSADMHVVGTTSGVFKTRSIRRLPVSEQVDKQLLNKTSKRSLGILKVEARTLTFSYFLKHRKVKGLPTLPVQQTDGTSAVDSSQHGLKRKLRDELGDKAQERRVGPAQSDLKRSAPDSVQGARRNFNGFLPCLKTIHFQLLVLVLLQFPPRVDLMFPIEPNVDREEELQALRQQTEKPVIWYDTEFDCERGNCRNE